MKIRQSVEFGYDINYKAVWEACTDLLKKCKDMQGVADMFNKNVPVSHAEIVSVYYDRTREIAASILKKVERAYFELVELIGSAEGFATKIDIVNNVLK